MVRTTVAQMVTQRRILGPGADGFGGGSALDAAMSSRC
jgi:hypothetical protein